MHDYETIEEADRYTWANVRTLELYSKSAANKIAPAIERCLDSNGACGHAICQRCGRSLRIRMAEWFQDQRNRCHGLCYQVTILNRLVSGDELAAIDLEAEHRLLRQQLRRRDFAAVGIGGTELSWRRDSRKWMLHHHFVVFGGTTRDLKAVRTVTIGDAVERKVRIAKIAEETFDEAASYCLKFGITQRLGSSLSGRSPRVVPLPQPYAGVLAAFFASRQVFEFLLLIGLRRRGNRLEQTAKPAQG